MTDKKNIITVTTMLVVKDWEFMFPMLVERSKCWDFIRQWMKFVRDPDARVFDCSAIMKVRLHGMFSGEEKTVRLRCENSLIGVMVDTFGTGTVADEKISDAICKLVDLRPAAIIQKFDLRRPIYKQVAAYGHMGREDLDISWEKTDLVDALKAAVK